jgi:co-chaperonin GroES (HSP10)
MRVIPQGDLILLEAVEFDTGGKIQQVDLSKDAPDRGRVVAFGSDFFVDDNGARCVVDRAGHVHECHFEEGAIVLFGKYSGIPCEGDLHLVRLADVIATVEDVVIKQKRSFDALGQAVPA